MDLICKSLNQANFCKPNQNLMNKNVTDVCIVKLWSAVIFRLCDVTKPQFNMHKQNNQFPANNNDFGSFLLMDEFEEKNHNLYSLKCNGGFYWLYPKC